MTRQELTKKRFYLTIEEVKNAMIVLHSQIEDDYVNADNKSSRSNHKRALARNEISLRIIATVPNSVELYHYKNSQKLNGLYINIGNIGEIFEATRTYELTNSFYVSSKSQADIIRLNNHTYELKSLTGKDQPLININDKPSKAEILIDNIVYRLDKNQWENLIDDYRTQRPSDKGTNKWRLENNQYIKEEIIAIGKKVKTY